MKRKFFTNLLLLLFLNLLVKPFWILGIDRTVQNTVGAGEYGIYFALFNFSLVLNMLLDLGITNFNNRTIARHRQLLPKYLSHLASLKLLLAVFYALCCLLVALLVGYDSRQIHLLWFLMGNQFLISFTYYLRSNISALHLFRTDSLLSVLDRLLMIILCSLLLFTHWLPGGFTINYFVYAQTAAYLLACLITFVILKRYSGPIRLKLNWKMSRVLFKQSFPFALLVLLMSVYNRIDSVLLERLLPDSGTTQAGIYAQAFRLFDAAAMFGLLFAGLLLPIFARMLKQREDVGQLVVFASELILVPVLLVVAAAVYYPVQLIGLLYHQHVLASAVLLKPLMIGFGGVAVSYVFGTLLTANGNLKRLNWLAFFFALFNIVGNVLFIPRMGALAAAHVAMYTQLGVALGQVFICWKLFRFRVNVLLLLKFAGYILFLLLLGRLSLYLNNWGLGLAVLLVFGLVYALAVKLIHLKAIVELLKERTA